MATSFCFYLSGVAANDCVDVAEDSRDRPWRPIPSGRISRRAALMACLLTALTGIALAVVAGTPAVFVALLLLGLIALYHAGFKSLPVLGALVLGGCRAASIYLGAVAASGEWLLPDRFLATGLAGLGGYIVVVSMLARHETRMQRPGLLREGPWLIWALAVVLSVRLRPLSLPIGLLMAISVWRPWRVARTLGRLPMPQAVQSSIGKLIRALLPMQAALALLSGQPGGLAFACIALALWGGAARLSRIGSGS